MSLLSDAFEKFIFMEKTRVPDGVGGFDEVWQEGAEFDAAIDLPISTLQTIANKLTERKNATLTTSRTIVLEVMEVVKRVEDGQYFRVTSSGLDNKTPKSATLDMRQVSVEYWTLPD